MEQDTVGAAQEYYDAGDFEKAKALLDAYAGEDTRAFLLEGRVLHQLSRHDAAAAAFRKAAMAPATKAQALAGLALACVNLELPDEAIAACDACIALAEESQDRNLQAEALKNMTLALLRKALVNEAATSIEKCLELSTDYPEGHMAMGLVRMMQMHGPDAEKHLQTALRLRPDFAGAYANLGFLYRRQNRLEEAAKMLQKAVDLGPTDHVSRNNLALAYKDLGQLENAENELQTATEMCPSSLAYRINLAALYRDTGRVDAAIEFNKDVLEQDPGNMVAISNLPSLLLQAGRLEDALAAAREAVGAFPDNPTPHYNYAVALLHARRLQESEEKALDALRMGLDQPAVHLCLSQSRTMMGRYASAYDAALAALEQREDARSHFCAAMALKGLERYDEAREHFKASMQFDPTDEQGAGAFLAALAAAEKDTGAESAPTGPMSQAYVKKLFDQYASTYDTHLLQGLQYKGPQELARVLGPHLQGADATEHNGLRILDLGCGTGLCAPVLRGWASTLYGCDLSANMVRKAKESNFYDEVAEAEAVQYLTEHPAMFDVVAAGDVLVYIGELASVFAAVRESLRAGGLFAFTTEAQEHPGYSMGKKGRYRHSACHLQEMAEQADFSIVSLDSVHVRHEEGAPVDGFVCLLRKS